MFCFVLYGDWFRIIKKQPVSYYNNEFILEITIFIHLF